MELVTVACGQRRIWATGDPGCEPRLELEWPSAQAFQAFVDDPENEDLHPLREDGTRNYLWWAYDKLEDLRPLLAR